jgi:hypothetical protein
MPVKSSQGQLRRQPESEGFPCHFCRRRRSQIAKKKARASKPGETGCHIRAMTTCCRSTMQRLERHSLLVWQLRSYVGSRYFYPHSSHAGTSCNNRASYIAKATINEVLVRKFVSYAGRLALRSSQCHEIAETDNMAMLVGISKLELDR